MRCRIREGLNVLALLALLVNGFLGCNDGASASAPSLAAPLALSDLPVADGALSPATRWSRPQAAALRVPRFRCLLPATANVSPASVFTSGRDWFAAHLPQGDVVVTIEANATAFLAPELAAMAGAARKGTRSAPIVSRTELVTEANWIEPDGTAWTIDVSCQNPDVHPKCVGETYIRSLVDSMRHVRAP